jgi:tRNA/tmRNA/rRNA uracil-C5-methylase (TrmA/RlmC/RlmD family)
MSRGGPDRAGTRLELEVGAVAHGGVCVARHDNRVVFVRHTLPGERVLAVVTQGREGDSFWRADAVEVLEASPDRVERPCPYSGPGRCGGCDWQHVALPAQRRLKAQVVEEQLRRLAGLERAVEVQPVPGDTEGLNWRTRVQFAVTDDGRLGLRRHRSHSIEVVDACPIAAPGVDAVEATTRRWQGASSVEVIAGADESAVVVTPKERGGRARLPRLAPDVSVMYAREGRAERVRGRTWLREEAAGRSWRVAGSGFWQVHPGAADTLVAAVVDGVRPRPGERALDLYSGVGLFAGALADGVGVTGSVTAVESDSGAVADARRNLHEHGQVRIVPGRVDRALPGLGLDEVDVVVLDPPRSGAGTDVVASIVALRPRVTAYVACDPAALARDLRTFADAGYVLRSLRAFDCFPMTAHVECVAILEPEAPAATPIG